MSSLNEVRCGSSPQTRGGGFDEGEDGGVESPSLEKIKLIFNTFPPLSADRQASGKDNKMTFHETLGQRL